MWSLSLPWWEFVFRAVLVYFFVLALLRATGKRQTGQMSPFDLVLLLVLSNAVQNSMNGGDNSITGGLIVAATLVALNWLMGWVTWRSRRAELLIEGRPEILIHHGKIQEDIMQRQRISREELMAALRQQGCAGIPEVRTAILESDGSISVLKRDG